VGGLGGLICGRLSVISQRVVDDLTTKESTTSPSLFLAKKVCPVNVPNPRLVSPGAIVSPFFSLQSNAFQYVVIGKEFLL
jgi:hypothetical protein